MLQINGLRLAHEELLRMQSEMNMGGGNGLGPLLQVDSFWVMQNGYCMPCSIDSLRATNFLLDPRQGAAPPLSSDTKFSVTRLQASRRSGKAAALHGLHFVWHALGHAGHRPFAWR